jgi:hypothetical protein
MVSGYKYMNFTKVLDFELLVAAQSFIMFKVLAFLFESFKTFADTARWSSFR